MEYRRDQGIQEEFFGIGLTSRKNLCLNPDVSKERKGRSVDSKCRNLTASWVRAKAVRRRPEQGQDGDAMDVDQSPVPLCDFYEQLEAANSPNPIPNGIYTLEDLKAYGRKMRYCPYYLVRRAIPFANVIIYSYHYMLDPKVAELVSRELSKDSIVVFDEAHNIDNVCIESLSIDLTRPMLDASARSITVLSEKIEE
jgi:DNA excision repair protein ERCC-2